jgi:hypothetical protein
MKNINGKHIHPDFDGHLEKPFSKMTEKEKQMILEFNSWLRKGINLGKVKDVDPELYKKALS